MSPNINTHAPHGDKHWRQQRRQSSDFGEITNLQNGIPTINKEKYDRIFHKWWNPSECSIPRCWVCFMLEAGEAVTTEQEGTTITFYKGSEPWPKKE